jgi:tape measure domain-containing protein
MANGIDDTSRLNVEVDGTTAISNIERIQAGFRRLEAAVRRTANAFARLGSTTSTVFSRMRSIGAGMFRALGAGFRGLQRVARTFTSVFRNILKLMIGAGAAFTLFARSVTDTGNKINKFINTLVILKGDVTGATQELSMLFNMANKLGTSFSAAAAPFVKFAAAAAGTLSDQSIRDVFESFATVGVALQLSQSEVTGVFLALQQIASKGVVSMEELRLQLAERVPGAMRLGAQSMNMTMLEFEEAVRDRTINAGEFLEKFSAKLKETFGIAAGIASKRLFADIQRLGNAFLVFRQNIFAAGFEEGLKNLVRSATGFLNNNPELAEALGRFSKGIFDNVANFLNSLSADRVVNILNTLIGAFEALINALRDVAFYFQRAFGTEFKPLLSDIRSTSRIINDLIEQRNEIEQDVLTGQRVDEGRFFGLGQDKITVFDEAEMADKKLELAAITQQIFLMRTELERSRSKATELGIALGELPESPFEMLSTSTLANGPSSIEIPRIETIPEDERGGINFSNQPTTPSVITTDVTGALENAEILQTMTMPEFWQAIVDGRIRDGMEELVGMQFDYNQLVSEQDTLLAAIEERRTRIDEMLAADPSTIQAHELNNAIREQTQATEAFLAAEEDRLKLSKDINDELLRRQKLQDKIKNFQQSLEETFTSVQDVIFNSIKKTEDTLVELVTTGKASFKDLADSIVADLTRMAIQAFITRFILGPILGAASNALGSALGGTFATPAVGTAGAPAAIGGAAVAHTGGIVGSDVTSDGDNLFDKLRNNERPIIAEIGEGIFTKDQMKALAPVSELSPDTTVINESPKVEITNTVPDIKSNFSKLDDVVNAITLKSNMESNESPKVEITNTVPDIKSNLDTPISDLATALESSQSTSEPIIDIVNEEPKFEIINDTSDILRSLPNTISKAISNELHSLNMAPQTVFHTGGIVGKDSTNKSLNKLHKNEVSVTVEKGEGIFTENQMRALAPISQLRSLAKTRSQTSMTPVVSPTVNVNTAPPKIEIINNTSEEASVESSVSSDGTELTRIIIGTVNSDIASDGEISRLLRGKFGLINQTGRR